MQQSEFIKQYAEVKPQMPECSLSYSNIVWLLFLCPEKLRQWYQRMCAGCLKTWSVEIDLLTLSFKPISRLELNHPNLFDVLCMLQDNLQICYTFLLVVCAYLNVTISTSDIWVPSFQCASATAINFDPFMCNIVKLVIKAHSLSHLFIKLGTLNKQSVLSWFFMASIIP